LVNQLGNIENSSELTLYREQFDSYILENRFLNLPYSLYEPINYIMSIGGKRFRPLLTILSYSLFDQDHRQSFSAAMAIELFHNFTLVHDDIMDNDEMRHGVPTVHKKFGMPIAILAGDVLFSKAFQIITDSKLSPTATTQLVSRLSKACVDICEGQLLDVKMAEERKIPSQAEYITMIGKKTAALFDVSCAMGAICATNKTKGCRRLSF